LEPLLAITIGILVAAAVYLFLARDLPRNLIGFVLLGTAANLGILVSGRIGTMAPPLVAPGAEAVAANAANPLPQALVLTAIVIGFGLAAFALTLIVKSHRRLGSIQSEDMTIAEPQATAPSSATAAQKEAA
jgi:multicomponent Na+:H+ antiporter subunit C